MNRQTGIYGYSKQALADRYSQIQGWIVGINKYKQNMDRQTGINGYLKWAIANSIQVGIHGYRDGQLGKININHTYR